MECLYPKSNCRHCIFSSDHELFDGCCLQKVDDDIFERWAAKEKDLRQVSALRYIRKLDRMRADRCT